MTKLNSSSVSINLNSPAISPENLSFVFESAKKTSLFLLNELFFVIEHRLDQDSRDNLHCLLQFLSSEQSDYNLPQLKVTDAKMAVETTKFLKFYLEFNHISERFHRIMETREQHLVPNLLNEFKKNVKNISPDEFKKYCDEFQIDLVLTAHPTEIYERKVLKKYIHLMENLKLKVESKPSLFQKNLDKERHSLLLALWLSPSHRNERPSPKDEAKLAQMIYQYSLWDGLSQFKRLFHSFLREQNLPLEIKKNNFQYYSWMGGDRDGNPYVTATATASIVRSFIKKSCFLYYRSFKRLKEDLCFDIPLKNGTYLPEEVVEDCKQHIQKILDSNCDFEQLTKSESYIKQRMDELYDRLVEYNAKFLADQRLLNIIDRLNSFGIAGMKWDIRQESSYHDSVCDEIFKDHLRLPYSQMTEEQRLKFIADSHKKFKVWIESLGSKKISRQSQDFIQTLRLISRYGDKVFKYYIISMARSASDLLLIQKLLQSYGSMTQVVPLFETLEDLENSSEIMSTYFEQIKSTLNPKFKQLVMLGYSDSAKTGSRLASVWNLYHAQKSLSQISKSYGIPCWFFHGRGGSVGRGGGPVPQAVNSSPAESIQDGFRVTVQGEVIFDRFGYPEVAVQSMMTYIVSLLNYKFAKRKSPQLLEKVESMFEDLSEVSKDEYRSLTGSEEFFDYFEDVSPVNNMADLNIGSRPSKRQSSKKSYRAIPWIFGWTQNRSLLPAWYGAGKALDYAIEKYGEDQIKFMYENFYLFQSAIDSLYTTTLKVDLDIFDLYHNSLAQKNENTEHIHNKIKEEYELLLKNLPKLVNINAMSHMEIEEKLQGRLEVLVWLNTYQIELLKIQKEKSELPDELKELLILSIQGLASGMGNTG